MRLVNWVVVKGACVTIGFAAAAFMSFAPAANAVTYSTSGAPEQFSLGDTLGSLSDYDRLIINGSSGTFGVGPIVLNSLEFIAGVNAIVPHDYNNVFSFTESLTLSDGVGTTFTVPFNLSISYADTLTINGGTTFSFVDGGSLWQVAVNGLTIGPNPGGKMIANLTAQVTDPPAGVSQVPLPAALPLFISGLGAMGLLGWRRKRKNAASIAAA
jgi:hypothetical protein